MRKTLITCKADRSEPAWYELWQLSRERMMIYAERHGYEFNEFWYNDFNPDKYPGLYHGRLPVWPANPAMSSPCWLKIPAISEMIEQYDLIVYLDNDCVILDYSKDIADELPADKWLAMADVKTQEGCGPNIGVVVTRGNDLSFAPDFVPDEAYLFWQDAWASNAWKTAKWTDNGQVMHLLGYSTQPPLRKLRDTVYTPGYHILGEEWNGYGAGPGVVAPGCRIFHAAWGRDGQWKLQVMREAAAYADKAHAAR